MVLLKMKRPVGVEVAGRSKRSQAQDGLGSGEGPACARAIHSILDEVAARAFDDARRDGEPVAERLLKRVRVRSAR